MEDFHEQKATFLIELFRTGNFEPDPDRTRTEKNVRSGNRTGPDKAKSPVNTGPGPDRYKFFTQAKKTFYYRNSEKK